MQHTDRTTKILLCALVLFLGFLAGRAGLDLAAGPARTGSYDYIQYLGGFVGSSGAAMVLLDTRNGDVRIYGLTEQTVIHLGKLTELGRPLARTTTNTPAAPLSRPWPIQHARSVRPAPATPLPSVVPTSQQDREAGLARFWPPSV